MRADGARSPFPDSDQPVQLVRIALERLARAVIDDAAAVQHGGARRDVEGEAGGLPDPGPGPAFRLPPPPPRPRPLLADGRAQAPPGRLPQPPPPSAHE